MSKKWIIIGIIFLGLFVFLYLNQSKKVPNVNATSLQNRDIYISISTSGKIVANKEADLAFSKSGIITKINIQEGDTVSENQVLATLSTTEAYATYQSSLLAREKAVAAYDEIIETYGDDIGSSYPFYKRRQAEKVIGQSEQALTIASQQLSEYSIKCPFAGTVLEINKNVGETISGGSGVVIKVADLSSTYFEIEVDEEDLNQVAIGQNVEISLDSYPDKIIKGQVKSVGKIIAKDKDANNIIKVRVGFNNILDFEPVIELTGNAQIIKSVFNATPSLPLEAVSKQNGSSFVYVVENNVLIRKDVQIGPDDEEFIQILGGLESSDLVVYEVKDEKTKLKEGIRVRVNEASSN